MNVETFSQKFEENLLDLSYMGLKGTRKPVIRGLRTTQAQTSLRIRAVWSAPVLFPFWKVA